MSDWNDSFIANSLVPHRFGHTYGMSRFGRTDTVKSRFAQGRSRFGRTDTVKSRFAQGRSRYGHTNTDGASVFV